MSSQCLAPTRTGTPCGHPALHGRDMCPTHAPERQCGVLKDDGTHCTIATGGKGPCRWHRPAETQPETSRP